MKAYIINLDTRQDRWQECQSLPFELERFPAVKHDWGWMGLIITMDQLFKTKFTGEPMLVMEDDALWVRDMEIFDKALQELPADYDMLMLGANIRDGVHVHSEHLGVVHGAWTTHAILYSAEFIRSLMPILPDLTIPIDEHFRTVVHPRGRSYVVRPMVCYQRPSYSDIEGGVTDYVWMFEQSNQLMHNQ